MRIAKFVGTIIIQYPHIYADKTVIILAISKSIWRKIMITEKTQAEIDELFDRCVESENRCESAYRGMTYEQGIKATLDWLFNGMEHPLDEWL